MILFLTFVFVLIGITTKIYKESRNVQLYSGGDDNTHLSHLSGVVAKKEVDFLLVELTDTDESEEVYLDCTRCKSDFEKVSEGDAIKFYYFKYNVSSESIKVENIVL